MQYLTPKLHMGHAWLRRLRKLRSSPSLEAALGTLPIMGVYGYVRACVWGMS